MWMSLSKKMYVSPEADGVCFNDPSQALFVHMLNKE